MNWKEMNKKTKIIYGSVAACCLLVIVFVFSQMTSSGNTNGTNSAQTQSSSAENGTTGSAAAKDTKTDKDSEKEKDKDKETEKDSEKEGTGSSGGSTSSSKDGKDKTGTSSQSGAGKNTSFSLPYSIPDTDLVIQDILPYDGTYVEDGSDTEISGVATMVLTNEGDTPIEVADLSMDCGSESYQFRATDIAPGATMIVQDSNKTSYTDGGYSNFEKKIAVLDSFEMSEDVTVEENESKLKVTNVSSSDIPCVRIFYKLYSEEDDQYIGGITYTAKITDLKAGASVDIKPTHYLQGYSRIMMVRTYDSAE